MPQRRDRARRASFASLGLLCALALLSSCIAEEEPVDDSSAATAPDATADAIPGDGAGVAAGVAAGDDTPAPGTRTDAEVVAALYALICWADDPAAAPACLPPSAEVLDAIEEIGRSRDQRFLAPLIDLLQVDVGWEGQVRQALRSLTGQRLGDAPSWFAWYAQQYAARPPVPLVSGYAGWKATLLSLLPPPTATGYPELITDAVPRPDLLWWTGTAPGGRPPLTNPEMVHRLEERYLAPDDVVFGVLIGGEARAYPRRIVAWHGVVNDTVGGAPVALGYCLSCNGVRAFRGQTGGARITLAASGLAADGRALLYDGAGGRLWDVLSGVSYSGEAPLDPLPVATTTWATWAGRHPNTQVLSLDTGFVRDYETEAAIRSRTSPPSGAVPDPQLPALEPVVGVLGQTAAYAWPRAALEAATIRHEQIDGEALVFISAGPGTGVHVYRAPGLSASHLEGSGPGLRVVDEAGERWFVQPRALVSTIDGREYPAADWVDTGWGGWGGLARQAGLPVALGR